MLKIWKLIYIYYIYAPLSKILPVRTHYTDTAGQLAKSYFDTLLAKYERG